MFIRFHSELYINPWYSTNALEVEIRSFRTAARVPVVLRTNSAWASFEEVEHEHESQAGEEVTWIYSLRPPRDNGGKWDRGSWYFHVETWTTQPYLRELRIQLEKINAVSWCMTLTSAQTWLQHGVIRMPLQYSPTSPNIEPVGPTVWERLRC